MDNQTLEQLNSREIEILTLIADGLSNREIAHKLSLSLETIKWYNKQIFAKLGVSSRTQAVSVAKKLKVSSSVQSSLQEKGRPASKSSFEEGIPNQNRYTLGAVLGHGGMGSVYQAHDTILDREVAIKFLSRENDSEESRRRLLREAKAAAHLNHPNIISIFDVGESQGIPFIVMELVEGESLYIRKPKNLDEIIDIALQVCSALEHAHAKGIIHRDLKPENIVLTPLGTVKLLDFGLAHTSATRVSTQGALIGTVFYLAPEQALGRTPDGRSDLYSLGVILYELLTGRLPFLGDDPLSVVSQHLHAPVVPPSAYQPGAAAFDPVIQQLLAKDPEDRYASATLVAEALLALKGTISGTPSEALKEMSQSGSLLDHLARGRLVGRRSELNLLLDLWTRSQQGHVHLALISGEPGIGKTRLGNELVVNAELRGALVLRGGCYEYEATTPYLPFIEALRGWIHGQSTSILRDLLGSTACELARLAPEIESKLGPLVKNPPLPPNEERLRLFDTVATFFQTLAAKKGLLLFIDDLHWADQGTLSLLYYLLRNLRDDPVMVLGAYREIELDRTHPLAAALVEWNRERLTTRIPLDRFTFEDTTSLLATLFEQESVTEDFSSAMYTETEGNPFFIEEVVKALIEQGFIYREENKWERKDIAEIAIPQSVKEAIGRRLSRLSNLCLDVLHVASALGKEFDFGELAASSTLDEDQLLDGLDEASKAQLVRARTGESFSFTHDKIREVLYEELNPIRQKRLHQHIGEGLEKRYSGEILAHVQELAHHFTHSGDMPRSLRYSILAAEKAHQLYALEDALEYYQYAREAAEMLNETEQLALIHHRMGTIYAQRGPANMAVEHYEQAVSLEPDPKKRGAIKAEIGNVYAYVGDPRGLSYIDEALQELDAKTQASEIALATALIGRYYHYHAQHRIAIEYLNKALALAEPLKDPTSLNPIYSYLAGAYQHLTEFKTSMEWAQKNIAMGQQMKDPISEAIGNEFIAEDLLGMGRWRASLAHSARDLEIGQSTGAQEHVSWANYCQAVALLGLGEVEAAATPALNARSLAQNIGDLRLSALDGSALVQILSDMGRHEEANRLGEQVLQEADHLQHAFLQASVRYSVAYALFYQGSIGPALALFFQAEDLIRPTANLWAPLMYRPVMAEALAASGRMDEAGRLAEQAIQMARFADSPHNEAIALRVQAQVYAAAGQQEAAQAAIEESIRILTELDCKLELKRSLDCQWI